MASYRQQQEKKNFCILLVCLIVLIVSSQLVQGQFFTKSTTNQIPRVGRRSVGGSNSGPAMMSQNRRSMIDALVDEYGLDLVEALEAKARSEEKRVQPPGEIALTNDQPLEGEFSELPIEIFPLDLDEAVPGLSRDERMQQLPSRAASKKSSSNNNYNDSRKPSLAMRALNTNRLLQQLSSGQPPMSLYNMLLLNNQQRHARNSLDRDEERES